MSPLTTMPVLIYVSALAFLLAALFVVADRAQALVLTFRDMASRQRYTALAVVAGFLLILYSIGQGRKDAQLQILQRQFQLPANVDVSGIRIAKHSSSRRPRIEAVVHFSERQFQEYVRKIEDIGAWPPRFLDYDGLPVLSYSSEALRWDERDRPVFAGERRVRWGNLSRDETGRMYTGRVLCFALQRHAAEHDAFSKQTAGYRARACAEIGRQESIVVYVMGALDYDTRMLHMIIN